MSNAQSSGYWPVVSWEALSPPGSRSSSSEDKASRSEIGEALPPE